MANIAQLLIEHMDIWTAADTEKKSGRGRASGNAGSVYGVKKLRDLILELAVRGKLVTQYPDDEPASELLKRIQAEKAKLIAEGKLKKEKPLAPIAEDEKPFELPIGWKWTSLNEVADVIRGVTYGKSDASDVPLNDYVPLLRGNNIDRVLNFDKPVYVPKKLLNESQFVKKGDIVIAMSSGSADLVGKAAQSETDFNGGFGAFCGVVRSFSSDLFSYFSYFFQTPYYRNVVAGYGKGIGINNLQKSSLILLALPIPPLAEQHRIVAKVDELMALCDQLEQRHSNAQGAHEALVSQLLATLTQSQNAAEFNANWQRIYSHFDVLFTTEASIDVLKQTLLQLAVMGKLIPQGPNDEPANELLKRIQAKKARLIAEGKLKKEKPLAPIGENDKPFELPQGWEWIRLEQLAQVGTGATPLRTKPEYFSPAEINWVTSGETSNSFIFATEQFVSELALKETNLTVYPIGTLVIAMYGQGKTRGQISELMIQACTNQACAAIQLFDREPSHRKYVKLFFEKIYDEIRELSAGGAQPNLNLSKVKETIVPLPPINEQHRIVAKVDALMALCDQLKTRIQQANQQQQTIADVLVAQAVKPIAEIIDLANYRTVAACYAIKKMQNKRYFGRTAAMKVLYLAQAHIGLTLNLQPEREAAGPFNKWIYAFEKQGKHKGWFEVIETSIRDGKIKVEYQAKPALAEQSALIEKICSVDQHKEFDRLLGLFEDKNTEEAEIIATLFAAWNDFLIDGHTPSDDQIVKEVRENWHVNKARFTLEQLKNGLEWLRCNHIVPQGRLPHTVYQQQLVN